MPRPINRRALIVVTIGRIAAVNLKELSEHLGLSQTTVSRALNAGSRAEDLECPPPVVLANDEDRRAFDDTSGGTQPRAKAWWQFWK